MLNLPRSAADQGLGLTPRDTVFVDGTAQLYRFRRPGPEPRMERRMDTGPGGDSGQGQTAAVETGTGRAGAGSAATATARPVVLLVPSLINRWYVLDLRPGSSLCQALVAAGFDVFCLDWGQPEAEDRYLTWDDVVHRLGRMVRKVRRIQAHESQGDVVDIGLLGYCIGGTLCGIHTALQPQGIGALVNLAGPFDFSHAGFLRHMTDPRWFDPEAMTAAGNLTADQMQQGFQLLRPTAPLSKWVGYLDRMHDPAALAALEALDTWASDNIPFPAAAYTTWIRDFYQGNLLVQGQHFVRGSQVDLGRITAPLLTIVTERDAICPPAAATALGQLAGSLDQRTLSVPGGHVGAVVGRRASQTLYPAIAAWLQEKLCKLPN